MMYPLAKRLLDIVGAFAALILVCPLLIGCAGAIGLLMGRPILFRQVRPGLQGRPFTLIKFRTMTDARDAEGQFLPDGQRLTRLGRLLRSTSLDELPQLWNVLRGDMSLVGPRPLLMEYLPLYTVDQARRHEVKPGMTGWAQVQGRNALKWEEKFAMDVWYADRRSLLLDLRILLMTVKSVVTARQINQRGHATMAPFDGKLS